MARRFGRRKPKVLWLPVIGTQRGSAATAGEQYGGQFFAGDLLLGANHNPTVQFPVVIDDVPPDIVGSLATWQSATLLENIQAGYRLRRIVGKCHVGASLATGGQPATRSACVSVTAGFIVRRVDQGGLSLANSIDTLSSQTINANSDPYIWRRNWLLGTGVADPGALEATVALPHTTALYGGGNADGPHIDQKTARIVGPEERLFFEVSFISGLQLTGQDEVEETVRVFIHLDARFLASLKPGAGNRRNASR